MYVYYLWQEVELNATLSAPCHHVPSQRCIKAYKLSPHPPVCCRKGDVYVHAELHGASSTIVRNNDPAAPIPPLTLQQAGCACVCRSRAWDQKVVTSAYWVHHHQVRGLADKPACNHYHLAPVARQGTVILFILAE